MFEKVREPLRPVGRLEGQARGHGACDEEELPLDGGRHPAGPPPDHGIEAPDRLLQALHHAELRVPPIPVLRQQDDLSHVPIMGHTSDTSSEAGAVYATRTELTGARRSWAVNHEAPASAEPNTSPEVAPKYRPIPGPSPSTENACRRIVR